MSENHEAPAEVVEDQEVLDDDATPTDPETDPAPAEDAEDAEDQEVLDDDATPTDPETDPAPAEDAEAEDQADDDTPTPHEASKGYGVTAKFSTTNRNDL